MTPNELLIHTLIAGATAVRAASCPAAIRSAYGALVAELCHAHPDLDLGAIERRPTSPHSRGLLAEELAELGDSFTPEILAVAHTLLAAFTQAAPATATAIGVDLQEVKAAYLRLSNIRASVVGARVAQSEFTGGVEMGDVQLTVLLDNKTNGSSLSSSLSPSLRVENLLLAWRKAHKGRWGQPPAATFEMHMAECW